jgi:hypothetical protein
MQGVYFFLVLGLSFTNINHWIGIFKYVFDKLNFGKKKSFYEIQSLDHSYYDENNVIDENSENQYKNKYEDFD